MPTLGGALGDRAREVLPEEIDSAGDSDRPIVEADAFGRRGGRIEPRFVGCGRGGITMTDSHTFRTVTIVSRAMSVCFPNSCVIRMQRT